MGKRHIPCHCFCRGRISCGPAAAPCFPFLSSSLFPNLSSSTASFCHPRLFPLCHPCAREDPVSLYLVLPLVFVGAASHAARKQRRFFPPSSPPFPPPSSSPFPPLSSSPFPPLSSSPFPPLSSSPFPPLSSSPFPPLSSLRTRGSSVVVFGPSPCLRRGRISCGPQAAQFFPSVILDACPRPDRGSSQVKDPESFPSFVPAASHAANGQRHEMAPLQKRGPPFPPLSS